MTHTLTSEGFDASEDGTGRGTPLVAATLTSGSHYDRPPGRRQEDDTNVVVAATLPARGTTGGFDVDPSMAAGNHLVAQSLTARYGKGPDSDAGTGQIVADTLRSHPRPGSATPGAIAFHATQTPVDGEQSPSLTASAYIGAHSAAGVRRLTPTECERLMGWPDGWTYSDGPSLLDAPQTFPGGPAPVDTPPDGRRYAACGDGVVAHVAEWIGHGLALESTPSQQSGGAP